MERTKSHLVNIEDLMVSHEAQHSDTPGSCPSDVPAVPKKSRRSTLTKNACMQCRVAKTKCSGRHPTCNRCQRSGASCVYDVPQEGITKMQNLQQKLNDKTTALERLMAVINTLQNSTDEGASEVLARLRLGEDALELGAALAGDNSLLLTPTTPPGYSWPSTPFESSDSLPRRGTTVIPGDQDNNLMQAQAVQLSSTISLPGSLPSSPIHRSPYRSMPQIQLKGHDTPQSPFNSTSQGFYTIPAEAHSGLYRSSSYDISNSVAMTNVSKSHSTYGGYLWSCNHGDVFSSLQMMQGVNNHIIQDPRRTRSDS